MFSFKGGILPLQVKYILLEVGYLPFQMLYPQWDGLFINNDGDDWESKHCEVTGT